jgi:energy-coupling factor transporter transmembrane protein EcfT
MDPRFAFPGFLAVCAATFVVSGSPGGMALLLAYVVALYAAAGVLATAGRHLARLVPVVVLIVALNGLLTSGTPLLGGTPAGWLTREGVSGGVFYALRFLVLYYSVVLFVGVTAPEQFARAVYTLLLPFSRRAAGEAAFYSFNVLSFLPLFAGEIERIRTAQSFRGADFGGGLVRRVSAVRLLVAPLVVSAVSRSGQLAATVELRGLRYRLGEALPEIHSTWREYVFALATIVVLAVVVLFLRTGTV